MSRDIFREIFETNYTIINHDMVKKLDLVTAYWLCEIISWMKHLRKKKRLDEDGWFYYTQEHIKEKIGISTQRQNRIIKKLKFIGIMDAEKRGMPARNYYQINYEKLVLFLYGEIPKSIKTIDPSPIKIIDPSLLKQRDYYNSKNNIYPLNSKNGVYGALFDYIRENKKQILPSCIRDYTHFTIKIQKKQKEKHPSNYKQYSDQQLFRQLVHGTEVIDQLVRLDKWDFSTEIKPAIEWGIRDEDFWTHQIRSLARLRDKGSNGETKFNNIFNGWEMEKKRKKKKPFKKKYEDSRNPSRKVMERGEDGLLHAVWK